MLPPDAVVFDVNETLYPLAPVQEALAEVGIGGDATELWFTRVLRDGLASAACGAFGPMPELARHHAALMAAKAGHPDPGSAADQVLAAFDRIVPHPDVGPALERFAELGIRALTLTNGTIKITRGLLERAGIDSLVERILDVSTVGLWKPRPEAYHYGVEQLGLEPSRAMMIAVHAWDVHGAMRAGMLGAYVDRADTGDYPSVFQPPTLRVRDLIELADRLTLSEAAARD